MLQCQGVPCDHCLQPQRLDESYTVPIGLQLSKNKLSYDARDRIRKHRAKKGEQEGGTKQAILSISELMTKQTTPAIVSLLQKAATMRRLLFAPNDVSSNNKKEPPAIDDEVFSNNDDVAVDNDQFLDSENNSRTGEPDTSSVLKLHHLLMVQCSDPLELAHQFAQKEQFLFHCCSS